MDGYGVRVWLDDVREAPPEWVRRYTPEEVIELLRRGEVTELSLDHDLGLGGGGSERTGYAVLLWLEAEVGTGRWTRPLPAISVHSGNPVGRERMLRVLITIHRLHAMARSRARGPSSTTAIWPRFRGLAAWGRKSNADSGRSVIRASTSGWKPRQARIARTRSSAALALRTTTDRTMRETDSLRPARLFTPTYNEGCRGSGCLVRCS